MERPKTLVRRTGAPVARLAVKPLSGKFGPERTGPYGGRPRLPALHRGVFLWIDADYVIVDRSAYRRRAAHFAEVRLLLAFNLS